MRVLPIEVARLARLAVFLVAILMAACGRGPSDTNGNGAADAASDGSTSPAAPTGIRFLSSDAAEEDGFARASAPRPFEFPEDHAAHPRYRTEWWYFTGNLTADSNRHFGFELTLFRYALAANPPDSRSAWATNQVWMAHLAVTDTRNGRMIAEERLTRGALGLAGARAEPFRAWVEDWSVAGPSLEEGVTIDAEGDQIGLQLELTPLKAPVLHGDAGLDPKGPEPGNASYYYSISRIAAAGSVRVGDEIEDVQGLAWMDREWSTSALSPDVDGWDWFALQLADDTELMVYRLRRTDGTASPFSGGSFIDAEGRRTALEVDDIELEVLDEWLSEDTGALYPTAWRLSVPEVGLELEVRPYIEDQEIDLSVRYWEGAVRVEGAAQGMPVDGRGYLELAGY